MEHRLKTTIPHELTYTTKWFKVTLREIKDIFSVLLIMIINSKWFPNSIYQEGRWTGEILVRWISWRRAIAPKTVNNRWYFDVWEKGRATRSFVNINNCNRFSNAQPGALMMWCFMNYEPCAFFHCKWFFFFLNFNQLNVSISNNCPNKIIFFIFLSFFYFFLSFFSLF